MNLLAIFLCFLGWVPFPGAQGADEKSIEMLPKELRLEMSEFLDDQELARLARVSRRFGRVAKASTLGRASATKAFHLSHFPKKGASLAFLQKHLETYNANLEELDLTGLTKPSLWSPRAWLRSDLTLLLATARNRFQNLKVLRLPNVRLSTRDVEEISGMSKLEEVDLTNSEIGDWESTLLMPLVHLRKLHLEGTRVTFRFFRDFTQGNQLISLKLPTRAMEGNNFWRWVESHASSSPPSPVAQGWLGAKLRDEAGSPEESRRAELLLEEASRKGNSYAQNALGILYARIYAQTSVEENRKAHDKAALDQFHQAAAQGDATGEYNIGYMYENGRGVDRNEKEAKIWYQKSASKGFGKAQAALDRIAGQI